MVKLTVGGGEVFEALPAMRDATVLLSSAEFHAADEQYNDRIKFVYEVIDVTEEENEQHIGKEHFVYADLPKGKSGKLHPRSNLYGLLEGMSGGEFNPDDELDTDDYVGKKYIGDFKREQSQKKVGDKFVPAFADDGTPLRTTKLRNLRPIRPARRRRPVEEQAEHDWGDE